METKEILHTSPSKRSWNSHLAFLLKRADARESADIFYLITLYM